MGPRFQDRFDAGRFLAGQLGRYADDVDVTVLGMPRGGVPVAFEIASELHAPLDVFAVRRLRVPGHDELTMGVIASGGGRVLNEEVIRRLNVPEQVVGAVERDAAMDLARSEAAFRGSREPIPIRGRKVILADDGLATGQYMRDALRALKQLGPAFILVAVPIGSPETCDEFRAQVDELICGDMPEPFFSVGTWYSNFLPITDDEIRGLLDRAAHERRVLRTRLKAEAGSMQ